MAPGNPEHALGQRNDGLARDEPGDLRCRLAPHAGGDVRVDVEGDADARVAQPLADDLRMHACPQRQRRVSVPQPVERDRRQPSGLDVDRERLAEGPRVKLGSVLTGEQGSTIYVSRGLRPQRQRSIRGGGTMRRVMIIGVLLSALSAVASPAASAGGVNPAQLASAGWDCIVVLGAVHCAPPGGLARVLSGEAETMSFLVFQTTDGEFLGTELIVRADLFGGQPCPTDPPGQYTHLLLLLGLDYYACHRYDSSF